MRKRWKKAREKSPRKTCTTEKADEISITLGLYFSYFWGLIKYIGLHNKKTFEAESKFNGNKMTENKEVERALIPYFGEKYPEKAQDEAIKRVKKGGKICLLHIIDEGQTRSIRYMTGQLGEENELVETVQEAREKLQEKVAEDHSEKAKNIMAKHGISLYPNPVDNRLNYKVSETSLEQISIADLTGKIHVKKHNIMENGTIDVSELKPGIYIIRIQSNKGVFTSKIVKQ